MNKVKLLEIRFGSYVKLFFMSGLSFGLVLGVILFVISLFGAPVYARIGNTVYTGLYGGVLGLVISPLICSLISGWSSIMMYLPFKFLLKIVKGMDFQLNTRGSNNLQDSEK